MSQNFKHFYARGLLFLRLNVIVNASKTIDTFRATETILREIK